MDNCAVIGDAPRRREDARFVTGHGAYLDDLRFDGVTHAVLLRSPHAHARIAGIDVAAALAAPGVLAVLTGAGCAGPTGCSRCGPRRKPMSRPANRSPSRRSRCWRRDKVRHVGEPIALIVAETRAQAMDASRAGERRLRPLAGGDHRRCSQRPRGAVISAEVPGNVCLHWRTGDAAAVDTAFAAAAHVVCSSRQSPHRHQPDGAARRGRAWDAALDRYTAACLEPEHPRQPRCDAPAHWVSPPCSAVCRSRRRRRLRREELHLCRACADPVGGETRRPTGEMDRNAQRRFRFRPSGARPSAPRLPWRSTRMDGFWRFASPASPMPAPTGGGSGAVQTVPVRPPAGHSLSHPGNRAADQCRADQYGAGRCHPWPGLCRGGQHHRAADRQGGAGNAVSIAPSCGASTWSRPRRCR